MAEQKIIKVAVIIPYFQRSSGILKRALESILCQRLTRHIHVDIIIVDDASPAAVAPEIEDLVFAPPFNLTVLTQENSGVGGARNSGLHAVAQDTDYISFLDSDDSWYPDHLQSGITALEQGNDFYFCDNKREGMHESSFASGDALIMPFISNKNSELINISKEILLTLTLKSLPCHISATIFRREIAADIYFNTVIKTAGEDMIYLMHVVKNAKGICFSPQVNVECGSGVNIFFGNMAWDSPGLLGTVIDKLRTHQYIQQNIVLPEQSAAWNSCKIKSLRINFAYHSVRRIIKLRAFPNEIKRLAIEDKFFLCWFPYYALGAFIGKPLGLFKPE